MKLHDLMRMGDVQRWHIVATARSQTVADHSMRVTAIGMRIYELKYPMTSNCAGSELMCALLFHDAPEVLLGDTPAPSKERVAMCAGMPSLYTDADRATMPTIPYSGTRLPLPEWVSNIVGLADMIEASTWISDHGSGEYARWVSAGCSSKMWDFANKTGMSEIAQQVVHEIQYSTEYVKERDSRPICNVSREELQQAIDEIEQRSRDARN